MKLADVPKFDRTVFIKEELADLQGFMDLCVKAQASGSVEEVRAELDQRRADHRAMTREAAARSYSIHALHKRLIRFVPRPLDHEEVEG